MFLKPVIPQDLSRRVNGTAATTARKWWPLCVLLTVATVSSVGAAQPAADANPIPPGVVQLTLRQAEALLQQRNPEVQLARIAVQGAVADTVAAAQQPNPNLSVNTASINPGNGIGTGRPWERQVDTVVRFEQQIERGNKRELRTGAAQAAAAASEQDLAEIGRQQRLVLYSAYYDLLLAQEKERISYEAIALCEKSMAEIAAVPGMAAADYVRLNVDRLKALNDARQAQAERERAQAALAYLLGIEHDARLIRADDPWPQLRTQPAPPGLDRVLARRYDFAAAAARLQAAEQGRELARALRTRDVTVGAQLERYPSVDGSSVGLGISIPLFIRHYYEGEIRRAEANVLAAQLNVQRTRALVAAELARSRADLDSASERAKRYDEVLLREAQSAAAAAEQTYGSGKLGVMDLLDARRGLYSTRIDAAVARSDYAKALAAWQAAILQLTPD